MGTNGDMIDLGDVLSSAVSAARHGDVPLLEVQLASLRRLNADGVASICVKLRAIASAARTHPTFRQQPAIAAG